MSFSRFLTSLAKASVPTFSVAWLSPCDLAHGYLASERFGQQERIKSELQFVFLCKESDSKLAIPAPTFGLTA